MKKILVMGSNFGSMELIWRAKERGLHTIVTDYYDPSRSNAKLYCDECWDISTTETEKLAQKCREEQVDAVTCGVSEFNSEQTFKLCDRLGLPKYGSWEAWSVARNKKLFKDLCRDHGAPVAKDYYITDPYDSGQIRGIRFPVVVKPVDCGGNLGVSFCSDAAELQKAFDLAREVSGHKDTIICERMLKGREYVCVYALAEGEARLLSVFSMLCEPGVPTNVYSLDVTGSGDVRDLYMQEADENVRKVFKAAGFRDGIAWVEIMHDQDGHVYVLEVGYRLPGGMLPYTFDKVIGFNALDWYLDSFLGICHKKEELHLLDLREKAYGMSYLLWNDRAGIIREITGLDVIQSINEHVVIDFARRPGQKIGAYSLMGEILYSTQDYTELTDMIRTISERVKVIDNEGKNILISFTQLQNISREHFH